MYTPCYIKQVFSGDARTKSHRRRRRRMYTNVVH